MQRSSDVVPHICASGSVRVSAPGRARRASPREATSSVSHSIDATTTATTMAMLASPTLSRAEDTKPANNSKDYGDADANKSSSSDSGSRSSTMPTSCAAAATATAMTATTVASPAPVAAVTSSVACSDVHMASQDDGSGSKSSSSSGNGSSDRNVVDADTTSGGATSKVTPAAMLHTAEAAQRARSGGRDGADEQATRTSPLSPSPLPPSSVRRCVEHVTPHVCNTGARVAWLQDRYPLLRVLPVCVLHEQLYGDEEGDNNEDKRMHAAAVAVASSPVKPQPLSSSTLLPQCSALRQHVVDLAASFEERNALRALLWGGCTPALVRPAVWRLLCGYAPALVSAQARDLQRKRAEYAHAAAQYYYCYDATTATAANNNNNNNTAYAGQASSLMLSSSPMTTSRQARDNDKHKETKEDTHESTLHTSPSPSSSLLSLSSFPRSLPAHERAIVRQIQLDLPRHTTPVFQCTRTAASLARCLFLWSQRHPAVGYVQGMDDLVGVFYHVFLADALWQATRTTRAAAGEASCRCCANVDMLVQHANATRTAGDDDGDDECGDEACKDRCTLRSSPQQQQSASSSSRTMAPCVHSVTALWQLSRSALEAAVATLSAPVMTQVEADAYGCAGAMLSQLQDNYTHGLPGTTTLARRLEALLRRAADAHDLVALLDGRGVSVTAVCFPWLHCLLARELPLPLVVRLWDSYLAMGGDDWPLFHVYVCAALLCSLYRALARAPSEMTVTILHEPFVYAMATAAAPPPPVVAVTSSSTSLRAASAAAAAAKTTTVAQPTATTAAAATTTTVATSSAARHYRDEQRRQRVWLSVLIADAYRLWRLYPPHTLSSSASFSS